MGILLELMVVILLNLFDEMRVHILYVFEIIPKDWVH